MDNLKNQYEVISWSEFAKEFNPNFQMPFEDFIEDCEQEIRIYRAKEDGNVYFSDNLDIEDYSENACSLVIDGNLIVDGNICPYAECGGNFIYVNGNVKSKNIFLNGCTSLTVTGNINVEHGIIGMYGDDGGYLDVNGEVNAKVIINETYFNMNFSSPVNATIIDNSYGELEADYTEDNIDEAFVESVSDGFDYDIWKIIEHLKEGKNVLKNASSKIDLLSEISFDENKNNAGFINGEIALNSYSSLSEHLDYLDNNSQIRIFKGDAYFNGALFLDYSSESWDKSTSGIIVDGNLYIKEDITNFDGAHSPFLYVTGNVIAKNINKTGSMIVIDGNCSVENTIYGEYNNGILFVGGEVYAQLIINNDHFLSFNKINSKSITLNMFSNYENYDFYKNDIPYIFIETIVKEDSLDIDSLIEKINSGKKVFTPGINPSKILLNEYLENPENVFELNFEDYNLKSFPNDILKFKNLKTLVLDGNNIPFIPERIEELTNLEELSLEKCNLYELPSSLARMKNLKNLNISNNSNLNIPTEFSNFQNLKTLISDSNPINKIDFLKELNSIEVLSIEYNSDEKSIDFPNFLINLTNLKELNIKGNNFKSLPNEFLNLKFLEKLNLSYTLKNLEFLPDLSKLENLISLTASGSEFKEKDSQKRDNFFKIFFSIKSLEELKIDRYDSSLIKSESLIGIGNLENLKILDLSFNKLTDIPEDFFNLKNLTDLDISYNALPKNICEKIAKFLPNSKIDFKYQDNGQNYQDPDLLKVRDCILKGNDKRYYIENFLEAIDFYDEGLQLYKDGKVSDEYNLVYLHYSKLWVYSQYPSKNSSLTPEEVIKYKKLAHEEAEKCLNILPSWIPFHYTDEGQFYEEVTRYASNTKAWLMHEASDNLNELEEALKIIERGCQFVNDSTHYYLYDTKVRILLKLKKENEAFKIVRTILNEFPDFNDFQDFYQNEKYLEWEKNISK